MFRVLRWLPFGAALLCSVIAPAAVAGGKASPEVLRAVRTGEARVLVALDVAPQRDPAGLARAVAQAQERVLAGVDPSAVRVVSRMDHLPILSMDLGRDGLEQLLAQPGVRAVQLDRERVLHDVESDALTHASTVHGFGSTGAGIRVAVVDSGINAGHVNLADDLVAQACFRTEGDCPAGPNDATDQNGHGTHVAGIITGAGGVAPDAEIIALKVFTTGNTSDTNILNALNAIVANHASWQTRVVNMSLGGANYADQASCDASNAAYALAFSTLNSLGIAVFVSTGNDADINGVGAPGCVTGAIGVGSVGDAVFTLNFAACTDNGEPDKVTCFSNTTPVQGAGELVDLLAPGCQITAEWVGSPTATNTICGTSMATPAAAGIGALMLQVDPTLAPVDLENLLEDTGDLVTDYRNGVQYPRINAATAYDEIAITLPGAPVLTATAQNATQIALQWTDISGEDAYEVRHSPDGLSWTLVATPGQDVTAFVHEPGACGPQYYRVRGVETGVGFSLYSNIADASLRDCPLAPTGLVASVLAADLVQLVWADNATDETGYRVERRADGGAWTEVAALPAGSDSHEDPVPECAFYDYRVRAERNGDFSAWSGEVPVNPCAPANDLIANAQPVTGDAVFVEPGLRYATTSLDDPVPSCGFYGAAPAHSLWYAVTVDEERLVTIETDGSGLVDEDSLLAVYTGSPGALAEVACNDDIDLFSNQWYSRVSLTLEPGITYYVQVGQNYPVATTTDMTLQTSFVFSGAPVTPDNDLFANAEAVPSLSWTELEPNWQLATRSPDDPQFQPDGSRCMSGLFPRNGTNTLWYSFDPPSNGQLDIVVTGPLGHDTVVAVFTGASLAELVQIACDDEGGAGSLSALIDVPVTAGTRYYIHVGRWSNTPLATAQTLALQFEFTGPAVLPVDFSLLAPANGAMLDAPPAMFDWTPSINAESYELLIGNGEVELVIPNITANQYALDTEQLESLADGDYLWEVVAHNSEGSVPAVNGPFAFSLETGPGPFNLSAPVNDARFVLPETPESFSWSASEGATGYILQVSDGNGDPLLEVAGITGLAYALSPEERALFALPGLYEWNVVAVDADGEQQADNGSFVFVVLDQLIFQHGFED